jgi:uracil-DNA glycosylase
VRSETVGWLADARRPASAPPRTPRIVQPPRPPAVAKRPVRAPAADVVPHSSPTPAVPSARVASAPVSKADALAELRQRTLACLQCSHLAASRKNVVFGVGDPNSPIMFVGEAPGADEDAQGEPFVGPAGQLLSRIIKAMNFSRETVYIANVLKCRPDTPAQASGNRKPTSAEMQTCLPYLLEQIRIIQPKVIVALGATAVEGLFGRTMPITKARGTWQTFDKTPVMPTFHPSYLLRNQASAVKRQVWEDMLQVLERLGLPISDKQRNYFT